MFRATLLATLTVALTAAPSFAQGRRGRGGGRGGPGPSALVKMPEVQKELKMDDGQVALVNAIQIERPNFQDLQALSPEERTQKLADMRKDEEKKVDDVLKPDQIKRLKQLEIQAAGTGALMQPEIADKLKITADQKQKIQDIQMKAGAAMRELFTNGGFQPGQPPSQEFQDKMAAARAATDKEILAVLTSSQQSDFAAMQGPKFTFPPFQFGRGRRAGA